MPARATRTFLDTNIFVYSIDHSEASKRSLSRTLIRLAQTDGTGVISYQVIHELANVSLKSRFRLTPSETRRVIRDLCEPLEIVPFSLELVDDALSLHERHQLGWYDALIVAAARVARCDVLLSEDLQTGMSFGTLRVENPFVDPPLASRS